MVEGVGDTQEIHRPLGVVGYGGLSAVGDGPHPDHHGAGVHQVVPLAHTAPGQLPLVKTREVKAPSGGIHRADGVAGREARLLGVALERLAAQLGGKLAEGHVAGVGEGLLQTLVPVGAGADDGLAADDDAAVTVVDPALRVRDGLKGRRHRHGLKDGAGGEGGGHDTL